MTCKTGEARGSQSITCSKYANQTTPKTAITGGKIIMAAGKSMGQNKRTPITESTPKIMFKLFPTAF